IEARTLASFVRERQLVSVGHGQRIDLPAKKRFACERDLLRDASSLSSDRPAEVHAGGVLDENVELRTRLCVERDAALIQATIDGAYELFVDVDLRVAV